MVTKIKNIRMCNVHELFWCFSVTVSTIYCFHPKFRLFFVRNWILLYINKNAKRCAQMSRSSYCRFTFLCLAFGHLVQNKQIVKVLWISTHQTLLRGKTRWFQVSLWFLSPSIWTPLTTAIDLSVSSAAVPEEWKYARVTVHFIKMGMRSVWISTVRSPFYWWLRRSLKKPCKYSSSNIQIIPVSYLPSTEVFEKNILSSTRLHISGIVLGNALTKVVLRQRCLSTFEKHSTVKITNFS